MNKDIQHIIERWKALIPRQRLVRASSTFIEVIQLWTGQEDIFLSTEFSRLAYFIQKNSLSNQAKLGLYALRRALHKKELQGEAFSEDEALLFLSELTFEWLRIFDEKGQMPYFPFEEVPKVLLGKVSEQKPFIGQKRWLLVDRIADETRTFVAIDEAEPENELLVVLPEHSSLLNKDMSDALGTTIPFPMYVTLFDISIGEGKYFPDYYVILPDYLVDVTAVASGYQSNAFSLLPFFIRRVLPSETTYYMLLGNVINQSLDKLIVDPQVKIETLFRQIFEYFPLEILRLDDQKVRELLTTVKSHVQTLRRVLSIDFQKLGLDPAKCELEPSFLSAEYGLQGRLDILHRDQETTIIELKSGKPFRPNSYGIKVDHYVQTLLYDLMIRSANISQSPRNFILYSSQADKPLRYAPPLKAIQKEALNGRNQIALMDAFMRQEDPHELARLFNYLLKIKLEGESSFTLRDLEIIRAMLHQADEIEKSFFFHFFGFIMRELAIAKVGLHGRDQANGLANVWLKNEKEKLDEYSLLSHLKLRGHKLENGQVILQFDFDEKTDRLANFRQGDVVILYPYQPVQSAVLENQVHKSSIIKRDSNGIEIRLRSKQYDEEFFEKTQYWSVERDVLDSSFNASFDSLFLFLSALKSKRNIILGRDLPESTSSTFDLNYSFSKMLLPDQVGILKKIYLSKDYFLLWGPPGTGKTSVMIRELVKMYFLTGDRNIYLVAYTNRAVDELCSAIKSISPEIYNSAVRIGSSHSCSEESRELLFNHQIENVQDRKSLKRFIGEKRVFISTLASFWGKRQLVKNPGNDILIVDEASQILEPSLVGLLPMFHKFILVGDHLQLPAVSVQADRGGKIQNKALEDLGITDMKMSLFERLYHQIKNCDSGNCAILQHQGRMNREIMDFVNDHFYQGDLKHIPDVSRLVNEKPYSKVFGGRKVFVPSEIVKGDLSIKNNEDEARKVVKVIESWLAAESRNSNSIAPNECGVITPFRAQIALIKFHLHEAFGESADHISVDTVERYQGSARDLVIISLCLNRESQLATVVSESKEGVDRKFNVALTRAREQVVVIGYPGLMQKVKTYKAYIESAQVMEIPG